MSHVRATHLVGHHSHLRLLALSSLPVSLGRSLGLISTGHDYWGKREEIKGCIRDYKCKNMK